MTVDTTRITPADLAALLGSRLCHDLVSPLGAIGNGVELLEMSSEFPGLTASPELRLIAESVAAARARIQAFRMAFGQSKGEQRVASGALAALLQSASSNPRLRIEMDAEGDFARDETRMLMLAVMCLETALPWGGAVTASHDTGGWKLVGTAERAKADPELWFWLNAPDGQTPRSPAPSEVQFALLGESARAAGRRLTWALGDGGATICF